MHAVDERNMTKLLNLAISSSCDKKENNGFKPKRHFVSHVNKWLSATWKYIQEKSLSSPRTIELFESIPIVLKSGILYPLSNIFVLKEYKTCSLPPGIAEALEYFNVSILPNISADMQHSVVKNYIFSPSPSNVVKVFEHKLGKDLVGNDSVQKFNRSGTPAVKDMFATYLEDCELTPNVEKLLKKLCIFSIVGQIVPLRHVAMNDIQEEDQRILPVLRVDIMPPFEVINSSCAGLGRKLGGRLMTECEVYMEVMKMFVRPSTQHAYPLRVVQTFMKGFISKIVPSLKTPEKDQLSEIAKKVKFLVSKRGDAFAVEDLYHQKTSLEHLFWYEIDKFPNKLDGFTDKMLVGMRLLGMKTEESLTIEDLLKTAKCVENISTNNNRKQKKVTALLKYLNQKRNDLQASKRAFSGLAWVPVDPQRPSDFPKELPWFGRNGGYHSPKACVLREYANHVGCVAAIASTEIPQTLLDEFSSEMQPSMNMVMEQMHILQKTSPKLPLARLENILESVYEFFANGKVQGGVFSKKMIIWTGKSFVEPRRVYISSTNDSSDLRLEPYMYKLQEKWNAFNSFFLSIGCKDRLEAEDLLSILDEIKQKHDLQNRISSRTFKAEMTVIKDILNAFANNEVVLNNCDGLLVPVETEDDFCLRLLPVSVCTYKDDSIFSYDAEEEELNFVHGDIDIKLAIQLGVASQTSRIFAENEISEVITNMGQREDFIDRLNDILKQYPDGFAIPKEMLQNADDAKATCVKFIYDERDFSQKSTRYLFDSGMVECQGPAILVYNDAKFTDTDFLNITKTNAHTKENDTAKIGKFGLGFCSVYNLTDVPSIVSGNSILVLDPLSCHLGKTVQDRNNPGIRLKNIWKRPKLLRKWRDQFMPYTGVFGCDLSVDTKQVEFQGTLFRFPLRTKVSSISDRKYSKQKVKDLFLQLIKQAGNLPLFLQNVQSIEVFHIAKNGDPTRPKLLFKVKKHTSGMAKYVKKASKYLERSERFSDTEVFTISVEPQRANLHAAFNAEFRECVSSTMKWQVSWVLDAKSRYPVMKKPVSPLGSTAIPLSFSLRSNVVPFGFEKPGNFFCYLPLPSTERIDFPVYMNGNFVVDSSRRRLEQASTDTLQQPGSVWNDSLLSGAVCLSYIKLLEDLPISSTSNISQLWPVSKTNCHIKTLVSSFYEKVVSSQSRVFIKEGRKHSFQQCVFLDKSLRYGSKIGDEAFRFMDHVYKTQLNQDDVMMDLPNEIVSEMQKNTTVARLFEGQTISKFDFFSKYVMENLKSEYLQSHQSVRDAFILYMLRSDDTNLNNLLLAHDCIPVDAPDVLRKPCDLVDPNGNLFHLFFPQKDRFPRREFAKEQVQLRNLGMIFDSLVDHDDMVVEQARSISKLDKKFALNRIKCLLDYLDQDGDQIKNQFERLREGLSNVKFLPVMKAPTIWPRHLQWKADCEFTSPRNMVFPSEKNLVGSVCHVLENEKRLLQHKHILQLLGVATRKGLDVTMVLEQLGLVAKMEKGSLPPQTKQILKKMIQDTFVFFDSHLDRGSNTFLSSLASFRQQQLIFVNGHFISPDKCCIEKMKDMAPYLYSIPDEMIDKFPRTLKALGVEDQFKRKSLINVVQIIKEKSLGKKLKEADVRVTVNALSIITGGIVDDQLRAQLCVPDDKMVLRNIHDVCVDDEFGRSSSSRFSSFANYHFVHSCINLEMVQKLKITSKSSKMLEQYSSFAYSLGQKEELVTRLKNILTDYPKDTSILKELIQNADDAHATVVHFVYDMRHHRKDHMLGQTMNDVQGPALCVFNDKCFTENDVEGIVSLGIGSKQTDPTVTGKFGIGFNAVYHFTDVPSYMTVGEKTPNKKGHLHIFDPQCRYAPLARPDNPGMFLTDLERVKREFPDEFGKYLQEYLPAAEGTWFRFPLRTKDMEQSQISESTFCRKTVEELLMKLKYEARHVLLFLRHVRQIHISKLSAKGMSNIYSITAKVDENKEEGMGKYFDKVNATSMALRNGQSALKNVTQESFSYELSLSDSSSMEHGTYNVVQSVGFSDPSKVPQALSDHVRSKLIGLSPVGAVAYNRNGRGNTSNVAYCFLPLPIYTNLPVLVNGHFAVDKSRSHVHDDKMEITGMWNNNLLSTVIADAYVILLETLCNRTTPAELMIYFNAFPTFYGGDRSLWTNLSRSVLSIILDKQIRLFPVVHSESILWVSLKPQTRNGEHFPAFFDPCEDENQPEHSEKMSNCDNIGVSDESRYDLLEKISKYGSKGVADVLKRTGMKLVHPVFNAVLSSMRDAELVSSNGDATQPTFLQACNIIFFLKSWSSEFADKCQVTEFDIPVSETKLKNVDDVLKVLEACLEDSSIWTFPDDIDGLPLCVLENNTLMSFCSSHPVYLSQFAHLLPNCSNEFIHWALVSILRNFVTRSCKSLKQLTISDFSERLKRNLSTFCDGESDNPIAFNKSDQWCWMNWLQDFWRYLSQVNMDANEKENICNRQFSNLPLIPVLTDEGDLWLYPFSRASSILNISTFKDNSKQFVAFMELRLPKVMQSFEQFDFLMCNIIATSQRPDKVLQCLLYNVQATKCTLLSHGSCEALFQYIYYNFDTIIDKSSTHDVKRSILGLALHMLADDSMASIPENKTPVVLSDWIVPLQGLETICKLHSIVVCKPSCETVKQLYKKLNVTFCSSAQFYSSYLLSGDTASFLSNCELMAHLIYMNSNNLHNSIGQKLECLKFVSPIEKDSRQRKKACEFYSPHNKLCKTMCKDTELPPSPFDDFCWKDFMEAAGIKTFVSKGKILQFAREIESEGEKYTIGNIPHSLVSSSKELIHHILSNDEYVKDVELLKEMSIIKCIVPQTVNFTLTKIHPAYDNGSSLASFATSTFADNENISWTQFFVLPEYADPRKRRCQQLLSTHTLGVKETIHFKDFILHLEVVSKSLWTAFLEQYQKDTDTLPSEHVVCGVMEALYTYLQDHTDDISEAVVDPSIPLIHVKDQKLFLPPSQIVQNLSEPIPPFLCQIPFHYGKFIDLFLRLGCAKEANSRHYATVLSCIYQQIEASGIQQILEPELPKVKKAMLGLVESLQTGDDKSMADVETLYLPTEKTADGKRMLMDSTNANFVYVDNHIIEDRLTKGDIFFCCTFKDDLDPGKLVKFMKHLPQNLKPKLLSELVQEKLYTNPEITSSSEHADRLERCLHSHEFTDGLFKILQLNNLDRKEHREHTTGSLLQKLRQIRILSLSKLKQFWNSVDNENFSL